MQNKRLKTGIAIVLSLLFLVVFNSCEKDDEYDVKPVLTKEKQWTLEIFSAMKAIYLWNDALPVALDTAQYDTPEKALAYLSGLKINPETGQAIDNYSFLDKIGKFSGEINQGIASGDYGFMVIPAYNSSNQVSFFVTYVYKNSPAGMAGVARTYEIVRINGSDMVHPEVTSDGYLVPSSAGYTNLMNALFNSSTASFDFKKPDGSLLTTSLSVRSYAINSVLCDTIFNVGSRKVGYMVFNQFLGASAQTELTNTINTFQGSGVEDLIVDLRYNGGGSVETCEKFSNLIAPSTATGNKMFSYILNPALMQYYILKNESFTTYYTKNNTFQPTTIYFIVSGNTASAAELLINNLLPYYTGKLFLIGQTTYGKPCGFWSTPIGYTNNQTTIKEGYDLYAVSFEAVNANGEGGYYTGMTPGTSKYPGVLAYDSYWLNWGDLNDDCLAQAVNHISGGSFRTFSTHLRVKSVQVKSAFTLDRQFKGMIDFRER